MTKQENATHMAKLVKEFKSSDQSQKSHELKEGKLYYWVFKLTKPQQSTTSLG